MLLRLVLSAALLGCGAGAARTNVVHVDKEARSAANTSTELHSGSSSEVGALGETHSSADLRRSTAAIPPNATSSLDGVDASRRENVHARMSPEQISLRACYRSSVAAEKDLSGNLTIHFGVHRSGRVHAVRVDTRDLVGDFDSIVDCVIAATCQWELPTREGGDALVSFEIPMQLTPSK